jgi:VWFA-related protein
VTGSRISLSRYHALALTLGAVLAWPGGSLGAQSQTKDVTPEVENQAPFRLRAASNLVVVRVVVRDAQDKPVENLKKEDFQLFDRGKEQSLAQFAVETALPPSSSSAVALAPRRAEPGAQPAGPRKFLALYFDDLYTSPAEMMQARDAADRSLAASLQPEDRVAIFSSTKMLSDFTADGKQIHGALSKLHVSRGSIRDCPDISDYQAQEIVDSGGNPANDALEVALDEAIHACQMTMIEALQEVPAMARSVVNETQILSRTSLQKLEGIVQCLSQMPGQRTIILVSPGFPSPSEQRQLDRLISRALRAQVVISSLDPKGLALLMRQADVTRAYAPMSGQLVGAQRALDWGREAAATEVLAEVAQGTGGEFFHHNNDLKSGFGGLAGSPVYYILAFAPTNLKADGKFHVLKVTLAGTKRGLSIQARRGYFAPKNQAEAEADAKEENAFDAEVRAREQIRQAILSDTKVRQLPVALKGKVSGVKGQRLELSLFSHLDARPLHFHKEGVHNLNTVTFVFAVFDQKENLVDSQQRRAMVSVLDSQLPALFEAGVEEDVTFQLEPGGYRIREVVTDSEDHQMTAVSYNVKIP